MSPGIFTGVLSARILFPGILIPWILSYEILSPGIMSYCYWMGFVRRDYATWDFVL